MPSTPPDHQPASFVTQPAVFLKNGIAYRLDLSTLSLKGWACGGTSSWFLQEVIGIAREQLSGKLTRTEVLQLTAETLDLRIAELEDAMSWNAQYTSLHDGCSMREAHFWLPEHEMP